MGGAAVVWFVGGSNDPLIWKCVVDFDLFSQTLAATAVSDASEPPPPPSSSTSFRGILGAAIQQLRN
jgi:hypothetical protein